MHAATATGARDVDGRVAGSGHCRRRRDGRQHDRCRRRGRSDEEALSGARVRFLGSGHGRDPNEQNGQFEHFQIRCASWQVASNAAGRRMRCVANGEPRTGLIYQPAIIVFLNLKKK